MAAQAERPMHVLAHACSRAKMFPALHGCTALAAVAVGVLGLLGGSWLRQLVAPWINIHALFALLLCGLVFGRYRWRVKQSPGMLPADIRELSRQISRMVYLLLYIVIGLRQIIAILIGVRHGGAVDFDLFDERFRNASGYAGINPKDDFQLFLATGVVTLIVVRVVAYGLWLGVVERAGPANSASAGPEKTLQ